MLIQTPLRSWTVSAFGLEREGDCLLSNSEGMGRDLSLL